MPHAKHQVPVRMRSPFLPLGFAKNHLIGSRIWVRIVRSGWQKLRNSELFLLGFMAYTYSKPPDTGTSINAIDIEKAGNKNNSM